MPAPSVNQIRAAIQTLLQQHPAAGKKRLVMLLNTQNNWCIGAKEFRKHLEAMNSEAAPPSHEEICAAVKILRVQNPAMGVKKFVTLLNTVKGWDVPTKDVRMCLVDVDADAELKDAEADGA